ncbi:MAG: ferrous iron transport protein A [Acidobacteria bacterium]|nr:ferrous iron transport protein A [Acidobacteriota bacterium]
MTPVAAPPFSQPISLNDLAEGTTARFHEAQLDPEACHQLRSLGLTSSCQLRICQQGEPCIVQVRSTRIGLSRAVARRIFVVPLSTGPLPSGSV